MASGRGSRAIRGRQRAGRAAAVAAGVTVLVAGLGAGSATAAVALGSHAAAYETLASGPKVKYYIVPPVADWRLQFLYQIAAQVLGNPGRYQEIFRLNEGRLEPGGGRLETPVSVDPGWILALPPDAAGPGVRFGVLPAARSSSGPGSQMAPGQASPPATAEAGTGQAGTGSADAGQAVLLAVVLMALIAVAWMVTRRRRAQPVSPAPDPLTSPAQPPAPGAAFRPGLLTPALAGPAVPSGATAGNPLPEATSRVPTLPLPSPRVDRPSGNGLEPSALSAADIPVPVDSPPDLTTPTVPPRAADPDDLPWPDYLMPPGTTRPPG